MGNSICDLKPFSRLLDTELERDSKYDDKKCGDEGSSNRLFELRDENAEWKKCQIKCAEDPDCMAVSGILEDWCIGCKVQLDTPAQGAKAYSRGEKGIVNVRAIRNSFKLMSFQSLKI